MQEKLFFTVFYLLLIPVFRIIFEFITKKIREKNSNDIPLSNGFFKFFKFYVYYLFPIMVLILIVNKWFFK